MRYARLGQTSTIDNRDSIWIGNVVIYEYSSIYCLYYLCFDMVLNCCENQRCSYHAHPSLATVSRILLSQYISLMTVTINTLAFQFGWKDLLHAVAGLCSTSLPDMELSAVYSSLTAAGTKTVVALSSRKGAPLIVL